MYQRSPVHEALFRLIQPVSATGFLTTMLGNWPRKIRVSSLMQFSREHILRSYLLYRDRRGGGGEVDSVEIKSKGNLSNGEGRNSFLNFN